MPQKIQTTIDIDASPDVVWDVVTDLERYAEWNPLITSSAGVVEVGERLTNRLEAPGGNARTFTVRVAAVDRPRQFEWNGTLFGIASLLNGRHRLELEATPAGTRLTHSEEFTGIAAPLIFRKPTIAQLEQGFGTMDQAIKTRAEAMAQKPSDRPTTPAFRSDR